MARKATVQEIEKAEAKAIARVLRDFNVAKDFRASNLEKDWATYNDLYNARRDEKPEGQSNLFIPKPFEQIQTSVAMIMSALFPKRPYANFSSRNGDEQQQQEAKIAQEVIDFQFSPIKTDIETKAYLYITQAALYGTAFGKTGWTKKMRKVRSWDFDPLTGERRQIETLEAIVDDPFFIPISVWDAYPDPKAEIGLKNAAFFIHRKVVTLESLQNVGEPVYKNLDKVRKLGTWDDKTSTSVKSLKKEREGETTDDGRIRCEVLEWWDGNGTRVITVANRQVVIRDQSNPFFHGRLPIVSTPFIPDEDGSLWGSSLLKQPESLFFELIDLRNQRMDNVNMMLERPLAVDTTMVDDLDTIVFERGAVMEVTGDPNRVIAVPEVPNVTQSCFEEEQIIKADIQSATRVTDYSKGVGAEGISNETATGISMLLEQTNKQLAPTLRLLQATFLIQVIEHFKHLNHQFAPDLLPYQKMDGSMGMSSYKHFAGDFAVEPTGSIAYTSKALRLQQSLMIFEKLGGHYNINPVPLLHEIFEMADFKNVLEIINPEGQPPKEEPKIIYTLKGDMSAQQMAEVLARDNIQTSPTDLNQQMIQESVDFAGKSAKVAQLGHQMQAPYEKIINDFVAETKRQAGGTGGNGKAKPVDR